MDIREKIEKETAALAVLKEKRDRIDAKMKEKKDHIKQLESEIKKQQMDEVTEILSKRGLQVDDLIADLKKNPFIIHKKTEED